MQKLERMQKLEKKVLSCTSSAAEADEYYKLKDEIKKEAEAAVPNVFKEYLDNSKIRNLSSSETLNLINLSTDIAATTIKVLFNSSLDDFIKIFGHLHGQALWNKYKVYYKGNEGDFLCYLDHGNRWLLTDATIKGMQSGKY